MGGFFATAIEKIMGKKESRILMVGLDAAGKTTILYKLKLGEVVTTIPTIGFNVETVRYKNLHFTVWDISGRSKITPLWRHYYQDTQSLIFVVDSNDKERMGKYKSDDSYFSETTASDSLHEMLREEKLKGAPLLVFANKKDLKTSLNINEIKERLGLSKINDREWHIESCCATTGDGLYQGLDWLSKVMNNKKK